MSFRATTFRQSLFVVLVLGLFATKAAFGQAATSPIAFVDQGAITTSFVAAPNAAPNGIVTSDESAEWFKIEYHYGTTANLTAPYVDAIQFKIWIEGRDMQATGVVNGQQVKGLAIALTGSETYVNVPAGKDIYGVFFVNPNTLGRYCQRTYSDFDRTFNIHIEAYINGQKMDYIDKNKETDPNWFAALKPITNLVYLQYQTPFIAYDSDRYPGIKLPDTSGQ